MRNMAFAMRVNFVDVVCDDSLRHTYVNGKKNGYAFDIRLSYYRGHYLSDIDEFEVTVDGETVPSYEVTFSINEKEFPVSQLSELYTEFWTLLEPAVIRVHHPGGLSAGEHQIDVKLFLRVPYLPLPGGKTDHDYMPLDSCGSKVLIMKDDIPGMADVHD